MITESELKQMIDGDHKTQDLVISRLMPSVLNICRCLSRGNSSHFNDLESLGLFTLVDTVRACNSPHPTFHLYIFKRVRGQLLNYLRSERRRRRISGNDAAIHFTCGCTPSNYSLDEELNHLQLTNLDLMIIKMKLDSYTMQEIADKLKCAKSTIYNTIEKVKYVYRIRNDNL